MISPAAAVVSENAPSDDGTQAVSLEVNWYPNFTAQDSSGNILQAQGLSSSVVLNSPFYGRTTAIDTVLSPLDYVPTYTTAGIVGFHLQSSDWFSGAVGVYISVYTGVDGVVTSKTIDSSVQYELFYTDDVGNSNTVPVTYTTFSPAVTGQFSKGVSLKARLVAESYAPVSDLTMRRIGAVNQFRFWGTGLDHISLYVPSLSVVATPSNDELTALENMADSIAQQSEILSAMYGDIISVCNSIYSRLGDIQATEELANSYFQQMISILGSINTNTANIYSLLQTQFELLKAVLATESDDIQSAIEKQTQDMIDYFNDTFSSAVGTLPDDTEDTQGVIDDAHQNDETYTADALGRFEEISATFSGFNGSVGSGVAVASTLFSRVWTAMGDYVIVYTFPLMLALALVIVGRLSRVHSKDSSKSKGGDDSG